MKPGMVWVKNRLAVLVMVTVIELVPLTVTVGGQTGVPIDADPVAPWASTWAAAW